MCNRLVFAIAFFTLVVAILPAQAAPPVVLELFTSQGCSSCPPADALLKNLSANDPDLLPLSFHVHYWDYLGWKDPFSSTANTERQRHYARSIGRGEVFTPQLIVNGQSSVIGSNSDDVRRAIARARQTAPAVDVAITPDAANNQLRIVLTAKDAKQLAGADIWGVSYGLHSRVEVANGENGGHTLENINNVTDIQHLGVWGQAASLHVPASASADGGYVVFVQQPELGKILGAGRLIRS